MSLDSVYHRYLHRVLNLNGSLACSAVTKNIEKRHAEENIYEVIANVICGF